MDPRVDQIFNPVPDVSLNSELEATSVNNKLLEEANKVSGTVKEFSDVNPSTAEDINGKVTLLAEGQNPTQIPGEVTIGISDETSEKAAEVAQEILKPIADIIPEEKVVPVETTVSEVPTEEAAAATTTAVVAGQSWKDRAFSKLNAKDLAFGLVSMFGIKYVYDIIIENAGIKAAIQTRNKEQVISYTNLAKKVVALAVSTFTVVSAITAGRSRWETGSFVWLASKESYLVHGIITGAVITFMNRPQPPIKRI